jgi:hypothetical protein
MRNLTTPVAQKIEALLVEEPGSVFLDKGLREDLRITIRIAVEVHEFLSQSDSPQKEGLSYTINTIRSGVDHFFSVAFVANTLSDFPSRRFYRPALPTTFAALKRLFQLSYKRLIDENCNPSQRLAHLLKLARLELVLMASHFPPLDG